MSVDPIAQFRTRLEEANEDLAEAWDALDPELRRLWAIADSRDVETDPRWTEFSAILRAQNPAAIVGNVGHWQGRLALALADATSADMLGKLASDRFPFIAGIAKVRLDNPAPRATIPVVLSSLQEGGFPLPGWAYGPEDTQEGWFETLRDLKARLEKGEVTEAQVAEYIGNLPEDWTDQMVDQVRSRLEGEADDDDPLLLVRHAELLPENPDLYLWAASSADGVVDQALSQTEVILDLPIHHGMSDDELVEWLALTERLTPDQRGRAQAVLLAPLDGWDYSEYPLDLSSASAFLGGATYSYTTGYFGDMVSVIIDQPGFPLSGTSMAEALLDAVRPGAYDLR